MEPCTATAALSAGRELYLSGSLPLVVSHRWHARSSAMLPASVALLTYAREYAAYASSTEDVPTSMVVSFRGSLNQGSFLHMFSLE